jgi:hypothetical protein
VTALSDIRRMLQYFKHQSDLVNRSELRIAVRSVEPSTYGFLTTFCSTHLPMTYRVHCCNLHYYPLVTHLINWEFGALPVQRSSCVQPTRCIPSLCRSISIRTNARPHHDPVDNSSCRNTVPTRRRSAQKVIRLNETGSPYFRKPLTARFIDRQRFYIYILHDSREKPFRYCSWHAASGSKEKNDS